MVYGVGLPPNVTSGGRRWDYVSGALDIVAHELAHGVTQFSSGLIYFGESGALNEAFSDIIAAGAEFYFAAQRGRPGNYALGDDVVTPGGIRSLADPLSYAHPDHYSRRYVGPAIVLAFTSIRALQIMRSISRLKAGIIAPLDARCRVWEQRTHFA